MSIRDKVSRAISDWQNSRNRRRILLMDDIAAGYIPLPKVASTSLRGVICRRQAKLAMPQYAELELDELIRQVEKMIRVSKNVRQTRKMAAKYFLFAFVRNPATRLYSCYLDKLVKPGREGKETSLRRYGMTADMTFDEFVHAVCAIPDDRSDKHFRSQHHHLFDGDGKLVHFIGKFESLNEEWRALMEQIPLGEPLPVERSSGAGDGLENLPLSKAGRRQLLDRYRKDVDLLGYAEEMERWTQES